MKVLMLGWEFPPNFAGGVGMVCYEIAKELSTHEDIEVDYVMPYGPRSKSFSNNFKIEGANYSKVKNINVFEIPSTLYAYDTTEEYLTRLRNESFCIEPSERIKTSKEIYGENILQEVHLYAQRVASFVEDRDFDVIHAHDWTTIPAALYLKKITGKPVVLHVHITEFDKTGGYPGHEKIMEIERDGFENADVLIPVSNHTKNRILNSYGVNPKRMEVIHNGGISDLVPEINENKFFEDSKMVLFAGRATMQKGPTYFVETAAKVLKYEPNTKFIMAGTGEQLNKCIELASNLGISKNILFHGFYTRKEADMFFGSADIFIMPSVSEPFGVVPFEAAAKGTPCIISKQSGISEVFENCFKVDFWDTDEMANKIVALLRYSPLHYHMKHSAFKEFQKFSWEKPVTRMINIYNEVK